MHAHAKPRAIAGQAGARSPDRPPSMLAGGGPPPAPPPFSPPPPGVSPLARAGARPGAGGGRRLAHQGGDNDDALPRRVLRVAGGERQAVVAEVFEDLDLVGFHDELLAHLVAKGALQGRHQDLVARSPLEVVERHAFDDDLVHPDVGDADAGGGVALRRGWRWGTGRGSRRWRLAGSLGRLVGDHDARLAQALLELVLEAPLRLGLADPRAPELVHHEQQDQDTERDEGPPDGTEDPGQPHRPRLPTGPGSLERGGAQWPMPTLEAAIPRH